MNLTIRVKPIKGGNKMVKEKQKIIIVVPMSDIQAFYNRIPDGNFYDDYEGILYKKSSTLNEWTAGFHVESKDRKIHANVFLEHSNDLLQEVLPIPDEFIYMRYLFPEVDIYIVPNEDTNIWEYA